ncbi:hypothetical protein QF012_004700 [Pseudomonas laurylsulfatiphila]
MWIPGHTGIYLQRVETSESNEIIIKIVRVSAAGVNFTNFTLHISTDADEYNLDFDPWSNMNVTPDNNIDEKDIELITQLGLAFFRQPIIGFDNGIFMYPGPEDLVDIFDPDKPIPPIPPQTIWVRMEVLDIEDDEGPTFNYLINARSFDQGMNFVITRIYPSSAPSYGDTPELEELAKAFLRLKL